MRKLTFWVETKCEKPTPEAMKYASSFKKIVALELKIDNKHILDCIIFSHSLLKYNFPNNSWSDLLFVCNEAFIVQVTRRLTVSLAY